MFYFYFIVISSFFFSLLSEEESVNVPLVSLLLVSVGSDVQILSVGIRAIISSEQVVVGVGVGPDGEVVFASVLDDPLVSVLVSTVVGSDVEVLVELAVVVVGDEYVLVGVGDRSDQVGVLPQVNEVHLVSVLLR